MGSGVCLEFFHADVAEEHFHRSVTVQLDSDGAFITQGGAGVVDHGCLVEEGLDAFIREDDAEVVPFAVFIGFDDLVGFAGVAPFFIFGGVDTGGHVDLEAAGDADLDLVTVTAEEDTGIVVFGEGFEFQFEFVVFVGGGGPEVGSGAAVIFDDDVGVLYFPAFVGEAGGADFPTGEGLAIEEAGGVGVGGEGGGAEAECQS